MTGKVHELRGTTLLEISYTPSLEIRNQAGVYYFAELNGMERSIPLNTYFTERLKNKPKQLPTLELLLWIGCRCIPSKYIADVLTIIATFMDYRELKRI